MTDPRCRGATAARASALAVLLLLGLASGGVLRAEHGRDYLAQYQIKNVTRPDSTHVQFVFQVLLSNYSGHAISEGTLVLSADVVDRRQLGTFPSRVRLGVGEQSLYTASITVPAETFQRWHGSAQPALWMDLPDPSGHPLRRPIDLSRQPLP